MFQLFKRSSFILLATLLTACGGGGGGGSDSGNNDGNSSSAKTISPDNSKIQYTGRWNFDTPEEPKASWTGTSVLVKFKGSSLKIDVDGGSGADQFRVIIDGSPKNNVLDISSGRDTYTLANNLSDEVHTVELMRETFYNDELTIYGFELEGALREPPSRPDLRIAFFGDSNMDGSSNYSEKDSGDSGTYYAFPAMTSRMLNAEMHLQAVAGATLDKGGDNDVRSFIFSEDYYNQDINYRSGFEPHVIVVNAGANDVGAGKNTIKNRYKDVISDLRSVYGSTPHIVLFNAYGWDLNEPANYTQEVVAEVGGNLTALHFPWLWEQWHGSQWDHSGQAYLLADHIASLDSAWSVENDNDIANSFSSDGDFANGSFEHVAPFGSFGWRYFTDGVERIKDADEAAQGKYYVRLEKDEEIHQATDATGDLLPGATTGGETYTIKAKMRGTAAGATAQISTHFQGQEVYTHDDNPASYQLTNFNLTTDWQEYTHTATAAAGVWQVYNFFIAKQGTIEIDDVSLTYSP